MLAAKRSLCDLLVIIAVLCAPFSAVVLEKTTPHEQTRITIEGPEGVSQKLKMTGDTLATFSYHPIAAIYQHSGPK
jgi:hypothetical protein